MTQVLMLRKLKHEERHQWMSRFYDQCLVPSFGRFDDELEPLDVFLTALGTDNAQYRLHVVLLLDENQQIMAGCCFELYKRSICGLLTYIVVKDEYRGKGLARNLIDLTISQLRDDSEGKIRCLFLETNSERVKDDIIDPAERLLIWQRLGFVPLRQLSYVQPALSASQSKCRDLILCYHSSYAVAKGLDSRIVLDWIEEFYEVLEGKDTSKDDVDLSQIRKHLKQVKFV
jgi:GNAT superfamily N-acetyltransferase